MKTMTISEFVAEFNAADDKGKVSLWTQVAKYRYDNYEPLKAAFRIVGKEVVDIVKEHHDDWVEWAKELPEGDDIAPIELVGDN